MNSKQFSYFLYQDHYNENFVDKAQLDRIKLDIEAKVSEPRKIFVILVMLL